MMVNHIESCVNCPVMRAEPRQLSARPREDKGVFGEDMAGYRNLPRK